MQPADIATIQALRQDLALQIARFVERSGNTQVAVARSLGIPQPTLSKIVNAQVSALSLELLIRIAVRARLPLILQTGRDPSEAGAFVAGRAPPERAQRSRLAERARDELDASAQRLTPEQRLDAQLQHSELLAELQSVKQEAHSGAAIRRRRQRQ